MTADYAGAIGKRHAVVIELQDRIVGYLIGWPEQDAYLIENLAVHPDWQGRGLGRALLEHAIGQARRMRLAAVRLYTNERMTENIAGYSRVGFIETHRASEQGFRRVHMRLPLD